MATNSAPNLHSLVICANMFVKKHDKFLVIKRSPSKIDLPSIVHPIGGKIDTNEDPLMAAKRELMEEAGIEVENVRLEAVITEVPDTNDPQYKETWLIFDFSGDYKTGDVKHTDEGELVWLSADEIKSSQLFPSKRELINHILDNETGTVFARFQYDKDRNIIGKQISITSK